MSDIQKQIEEALENATPGPWEWDINKIEKCDGDFYELGELGHPTDERNGLRILCVEKNKYKVDVISTWNEHDAHLIANAPTWLTHQQSIISQQSVELHAHQIVIDRLRDEVDIQSAEVERQAKEIANYKKWTPNAWEAMENIEKMESQLELAVKALEEIEKACRKRTFNDCGDLRAVVYDTVNEALSSIKSLGGNDT